MVTIKFQCGTLRVGLYFVVVAGKNLLICRLKGVRRNSLKGAKKCFFQISRDSHAEGLFLEVNILTALLGDLFAIIFSTMTINVILRFSEGGFA